MVRRLGLSNSGTSNSSTTYVFEGLAFTGPAVVRLEPFGSNFKPIASMFTEGLFDGSQFCRMIGSSIFGFGFHRFQERFYVYSLWYQIHIGAWVREWMTATVRHGRHRYTLSFHADYAIAVHRASPTELLPTFNLTFPMRPARRFLLRPCFTMMSTSIYRKVQYYTSNFHRTCRARIRRQNRW